MANSFVKSLTTTRQSRQMTSQNRQHGGPRIEPGTAPPKHGTLLTHGPRGPASFLRQLIGLSYILHTYIPPKPPVLVKNTARGSNAEVSSFLLRAPAGPRIIRDDIPAFRGPYFLRSRGPNVPRRFMSRKVEKVTLKSRGVWTRSESDLPSVGRPLYQHVEAGLAQLSAPGWDETQVVGSNPRLVPCPGAARDKPGSKIRPGEADNT
jgi:hypothetical protein